MAKKDNLERVIESWKSILREDPLNDWALGELKKIYQENERWNSLVDVIRGQIDALGADAVEEKISLLEEIIEIYQSRLFADEMVINKYYQAIFELDATHATAKRVVVETLKKEKRWKDYITIVAASAKKTSVVEEKVRLLQEIADLWIDQINDANGAEEPLKQILAIDRKNSKARQLLEDLYRRKRAWPKLLELLEERAGDLPDGERRDALVEMIGIASDRIGDRDLVTRLWHRVLQISPGDRDALAFLEQQATRAKDWHGLKEIIEKRIEHTKHGDELTGLLTKLAAIQKERLLDPAAAAKIWKRVIELNPGHRAAARALRECYIAANDWASVEKLYVKDGNIKGLAEMLGTMADTADDPETKKALSLRCIDLYNNRLNLPERSLRHYKRLLSADPDNEAAASALIPDFRRQRQWDNLLGAVSVVLRRTGKLKVDRDDAEALAALEAAARSAENWAVLVELLKHRRGLERIDPDGWRGLGLEIGELLLKKLKNEAEAVAVLGELLERSPSDREVKRAMLPLIAKGSQRVRAAKIIKPHLSDSDSWQLHAKVLEVMIESALDSEECLALQMKLAEVLGKKAGDNRGAFDALAAALYEHPADRRLWAGLTELAEPLGLLDELAEKLARAYRSGQLDEAEEVELALKLVELLSARLNREKETEPFRLKVLEANQADEACLRALEELYSGEKRWKELIGLLSRALKAEPKKELRAWLKSKLLKVVGEVADDIPLAIAASEAVLAMDPADERTVQTLIGLYERAGRWKDFYDLASSRIDTASDGLEERLNKLGEVALSAGKPLDAVSWWGRALEKNPAHAGARRGMARLLHNSAARQSAAAILGRIYEAEQAYEPLADVLVVQSEDPTLTARDRISIQLKLAALKAESLDDPVGAFRVLVTALGADPSNTEVTAAIGRVAAEIEYLEQYLAILDGAEAEIQGGDARSSDFRLALARIYSEDLSRIDRAEAIYRMILREAPSSEAAKTALEALERLLESRESWRELIELLRFKSRMGGTVENKKKILFRIAEIEESKTDRASEAIAVFKEILASDRGDRRALAGLERLLETEKRWLELIDILRKRSSLEKDPKIKRELFIRVTSLASKLGR